MLRMDYRTADEVPVEVDPDGATSMEIARNWIFSGDKQLQNEAVKLLNRLQEEFPNEPGVRPLLILALLEAGQWDEAQALLPEGGRGIEFIPNVLAESISSSSGGSTAEETLSRVGRMFRERAEAVIAQSPDDPSTRKRALELFRAACRYYQQAYRVRDGHYPLINLAELYLIKASFESDALRSNYMHVCHDLAATLLNRRAKWPVDFDDDEVWHAATEAHANILLGKWDTAFALLQLARSSMHWKPFHGTSIGKGLKRTLNALNRLGSPIDRRFENPESILEVDLAK